MLRKLYLRITYVFCILAVLISAGCDRYEDIGYSISEKEQPENIQWNEPQDVYKKNPQPEHDIWFGWLKKLFSLEESADELISNEVSIDYQQINIDDIDGDGVKDYIRGGSDTDLDNDGITDRSAGGTDADLDNDGKKDAIFGGPDRDLDNNGKDDIMDETIRFFNPGEVDLD